MTLPWIQVQIPARGTRPARTEIRFNPQYVRAVWQARTAHAPATRGIFPSDEPERLLLDQVLQYQNSTLFVQAWLIPAEKPAHFHMRVKVAAAPPLADNGLLLLHWGKDHYSVPLTAGEMEFEDISPPDFSRLKKNLPSPRFRLSFESANDRKNGRH